MGKSDFKLCYVVKFIFFEPTNRKLQKFQKLCLLDLFKILCDERYSKESKSGFLWTTLGTELKYFVFPDSSTVRTGCPFLLLVSFKIVIRFN